MSSSSAGCCRASGCAGRASGRCAARYVGESSAASASSTFPVSRAYRAYLESIPDEWRHLDALCHVTISRFYRDRGGFEFERTVLPELAAEADAGGVPLKAWSAGCASGEEPYTLVVAWQHAVHVAVPRVGLQVFASDA